MHIGTHTARVAIEAVKDSPPVAVVGITLYGVTLSDWVLILTAIYTLMRIAAFAYDRSKHGSKRGSTECPTHGADG